MAGSIGAWTDSRAARAVVGSVGVAGAALAAGLVVERQAIRRRRGRPDTTGAAERIRPIGGRRATVIAADGVALHVEETGPADAPLTLLFIHGFCVNSDNWVFQQSDLADLGRMVFFDQRAHGRSGQSRPARCTIDMLADDLYRVLRERVPTGPVILIGHSMGGMALLGLVDAHPELLGDQVIGVALVSTSAAGLSRAALGLSAVFSGAVRRIVPGVSVGMRRAAGILEHLRGSGSDASWELSRRIAFGGADVPTPVVTFLEEMVSATPIDVIAAFLPTLLDNDRLAAVGRLVHTPTLVAVGDLDLMTPVEHSRTIAAELPDAELVIEPGAGHALMLERPEALNAAIRRLVGRALADATLSQKRAGSDRPVTADSGGAPSRVGDAGGSAA